MGRTIVTTLMFCVFALCSTLAHAQLIAVEEFEYHAGPLDGQDGGLGWSGPWTASGMGAEVLEPGMFHPGYPSLGNSALSSQAATTIRELPLQSGGTVWIAFLAQSATGPEPLRWSGLSLFLGNQEKLFLGHRGNFGNDFHGIEVPGGPAANSAVGFEQQALAVARIEFDFDGSNERVFFWVNPGPTIPQDVDAVTSFTVPNLDFDRIRLATDGVGGFAAYFDEIWIVGQWEDITMAVPVESETWGKVKQRFEPRTGKN